MEVAILLDQDLLGIDRIGPEQPGRLIEHRRPLQRAHPDLAIEVLLEGIDERTRQPSFPFTLAQDAEVVIGGETRRPSRGHDRHSPPLTEGHPHLSALGGQQPREAGRRPQSLELEDVPLPFCIPHLQGVFRAFVGDPEVALTVEVERGHGTPLRAPVRVPVEGRIARVPKVSDLRAGNLNQAFLEASEHGHFRVEGVNAHVHWILHTVTTHLAFGRRNLPPPAAPAATESLLPVEGDARSIGSTGRHPKPFVPRVEADAGVASRAVRSQGAIERVPHRIESEDPRMRVGQPQSLGRSVQAIGLEVHVARLRTHRPGLSIRRPLNDAEWGRGPEPIAIGGKPKPGLVEFGGHLGPIAPGGGPPDRVRSFPAFEGDQSARFQGNQVNQVGPVQSRGRPGGGVPRERRPHRRRPQSRRGGGPPQVSTSGHRPHRQGDPTGFQFPGVADFLGVQVVFHNPDVGAQHHAVPVHHEAVGPFAAEQVGLRQVGHGHHVGEGAVRIQADKVEGALGVGHDRPRRIGSEGNGADVGATQALGLAEPLGFPGGRTAVIQGQGKHRRFGGHKGQPQLGRSRHIHAPREVGMVLPRPRRNLGRRRTSHPRTEQESREDTEPVHHQRHGK